MPRLSFIVPIYRTEHILERCIHALLAQSLKDWEAVFVLDGPSERARAIVEDCFRGVQLAHQVVEIAHGGACRARNEGAKHAIGDYWVFWDSDCIIEPGASRMWVETLDKREDVDFIYSGYSFLGERGAIASEPFDPWTLRVANYISTCFPFRAKLFPGWDESLESLQDWDFWLSMVERGARGFFVRGYAFSTEYPTPKSVSGRGCTKAAWLGRVDAVKRKHGIPDRDVCVSSLQYRAEGIALAKLIGADYQDVPNFKPHRYKTVVQLGFSLMASSVERHAGIFCAENNDTVLRRVVFWTAENIMDLYRSVSFEAIDSYVALLNNIAVHYAEDKRAADMLRRAGLQASVLPLPMRAADETALMPEKPRFLVDVEDRYGPALVAIDRSLPDMTLEVAGAGSRPQDYTGLIHFFSDKTTSASIKKALVAGRHVISNVQQPFCGYVDDQGSREKFVEDVVRRAREVVAQGGHNARGQAYYARALSATRLMEALA